MEDKQAIDKTAAYREGAEAYTAGIPMKTIPYARLSEQGASWLRGWNTARYGAMLSQTESAQIGKLA